MMLVGIIVTFIMGKRNYVGSEKTLPTLIKEVEPLWYWVMQHSVINK